MECKVSNKCGGCQLIGMPYEDTLKIKQEYIDNLFKGIGFKPASIVGADNPYYYRNKNHAAFGYYKGQVVSGTYEEGSHRIVSTDECLLQNQIASKIIKDIRKLSSDFKLPIYDEKTGRGLLRRVLVRTADSTNEILVVLVMKDTFFPGKKNFISKLRKLHPEITTIVININARKDSMILGDKSETAFGRGYIVDKLCGLKFKISPESFYQINHAQTEKLYSLAINYADLKKDSSVLDAYCGIGTIGLIASSQGASKVIAVELNKVAVKDAILNSKSNGITNTHFVSMDATEFMLQEASNHKSYDVVFLDPPRSGTTKEFIDACDKLSPSTIVYVSCGPETLIRDLKLFRDKGYELIEATPVDMFPWTKEHVETVCKLRRDK